MTNDFVALFKDTSLVSVIAVRELDQGIHDPVALEPEIPRTGAADRRLIPVHVGAAWVTCRDTWKDALSQSGES